MPPVPFHYDVIDLGNKTWCVNEGFCTMYILEGEKRSLVIDCGTGVGDFRSLIERITDKPYDLVITHCHTDHIGGRGQFDELSISQTDSKFIKKVTYLQRKAFVIVNSFMGNNFSGLNIKPVKSEPRLHIVREGDVFDLGGRTVKVFLTPGHTVGSISLLDSATRMLFTGDIANEFLFMWLPHCTTVSEMVLTLEHVLCIEGWDKFMPSHNTAPQTKEDMQKYIDGAKELMAEQPTNIPLPLVRTHDYKGAKLIYRTNIVHGGRNEH